MIDRNDEICIMNSMENKERLNIWLPKDLKRKIKIYAVKTDKTIQTIIAEAVEEKLRSKRSGS